MLVCHSLPAQHKLRTTDILFKFPTALGENKYPRDQPQADVDYLPRSLCRNGHVRNLIIVPFIPQNDTAVSSPLRLGGAIAESPRNEV